MLHVLQTEQFNITIIRSNYAVRLKWQGYRPPSEYEIGLRRKLPEKTTVVPPDCGP